VTETGPSIATESVPSTGRSMHEQAVASAARADLATVARGGAINLVGVITNTLFNFMLVLVVTRGLDTSRAGIFFESVALFSLLTTVAQWGSETGVVRTIPRYRVLGRTDDIRHSLVAGLAPVAIAGAVLGVVMFVWAMPLSSLLTNGRHADELAPVARVLAFFVPIGAVYTVGLAATRGFGTMTPTLVIDKIARAIAQPTLAFVVVTAGWSVSALAVAWASPFAGGLALVLWWTGSLLRRWEREPLDGAEGGAGVRHTFREFWRFTGPRGLASVFAVAILWLDTLLLGALRSPSEAGIYAAATRYLVVGQFIGVAILQVVGPKLSELLTAGDRERARSVYAVSTSWLILCAWPLYLSMIIMAPALLSVFGSAYATAQTTLAILGGAMLVATAVGPVDMVLLMAGKSSWNLMNTLIALVANVGLNLLLIPPFGMEGAAIAWAASIMINNLLPLAQVHRSLGLHPFGRGWLVAVAICVGTFGAVEVIARRAIGTELWVLVVAGVIAAALGLAAAARWRRPLHLEAFRDAARRSRARDAR
jgi:O-antigen/teichoic acid export membrane protein